MKTKHLIQLGMILLLFVKPPHRLCTKDENTDGLKLQPVYYIKWVWRIHAAPWMVARGGAGMTCDSVKSQVFL